MTCRSGCRTQDHETWGECARAAAIQIDRHGLKGFRGVERDKDRRLESYASLRKDGVQPKSTGWSDVRKAAEVGGVRPSTVTEAPSVANLPATD